MDAPKELPRPQCKGRTPTRLIRCPRKEAVTAPAWLRLPEWPGASENTPFRQPRVSEKLRTRAPANCKSKESRGREAGVRETHNDYHRVQLTRPEGNCSMARIYGLGHPACLTLTACGSQGGGECLAPSEGDTEWVNRPPGAFCGNSARL